MLDCGKPWKWIQKAMNFKTSQLSAICVTHQHNDHSQGAKDASMAGIDVFVSGEAKEHLGLEGHRIKTFEPLEQIVIGTLIIKPFPLEHDVPNYGFLIANNTGEKAAYITDTAYCKFRFPPLNLLAIECNYIRDILIKNVETGLIEVERKNRLIRSHFSLDNLLNMLRANDWSKLQECWLLHLSRDNSNEGYMKKAVQEVLGKPVFIAKE